MIVSLDFETYYDKEYSLKKLSEVEYILDPRFEVIMCAIKLGDAPSVSYVGYRDIELALSRIDFSTTAVLAHNIRFDGAILAWKFGHTPKLYLDTLSMARATTHWVIGRSGLKQVSDHLDLPPKGDEVLRAEGKRLADFTPEALDAYRIYCERDNDNCYQIFQKLLPSFTNRELVVIDLIARMFIEPQVMLDHDVLEEHLAEVRAEKAEALQVVAQYDKSVFSSNQKFVELLESYGVCVPTKWSVKQEKHIPAIARGDWEFKELCFDDTLSPIIQALLATRMSVKSTLDETRAERLLKQADLRWSCDRGWGTVPLKYSGARTHRLSGDGKVNWQNFRRGSTLRKAVRAPQGYRIVHRDSSQIEARMTAWMAGCATLLEAFTQGRDVYSEFASTIYDRPISKADTKERFVGKTAILGLGYSCGPAKYRHMLYVANGGVSVRVELDEAAHIVDTYRGQYPEVPALWYECDILLDRMITSPERIRVSRSPDFLSHVPIQTDTDRIWLPSGLCIRYPNLRHYRSEECNRIETCYDEPYGNGNPGMRKLYGGKVVENISQALARIVITDAAVRIYKSTRYRPWLSTHDSLDYCVPEEEAHNMNTLLGREFSIAPEWATGLPLSSEGGWGQTLQDAERASNQ